MGKIFDILTEYGESDAYPYHMPGHKRYEGEETAFFWKEYYKRDITEIDGFDGLHHADGILKEAMERAAKLYHSEHTYYLINGSSAGVLTAIMAAVPKGGSLIMMRSSHKSAYHALLLGGMRGIYLPSEVDTETGLDLGVTADQVISTAEAHPEAVAVFLTSPTYEGFSMPLREIAEALHKRNQLLIVDAAHGAHFGMAEYLPENAVEAGADIVIHSLHKTLPSPTQTALLHVNGDRVRISQIERYFSVFQTTSPSYVLMAGIDECICMLQNSKEKFFAAFYQKRKKLHDSLAGLKHIQIVDAFAPLSIPDGIPDNYVPEMGKLLLIPKQEYMTAREIYDVLRVQYHLQPEMATPMYVLLILTIMDTEEGYRRLSEALHEIDNNMEKKDNTKKYLKKRGKSDLPEAVYTIAEADAMEGEWISSEDAIGRISQGVVAVYPPGRPLLVPGERISEQVIEELKYSRSSGCEVHGIALWEEAPELFRLLCIRDR
ncbi:MAG: aminotransferase class I/II-fold pyridoxal phosphate-dependent enzyme [Lachnospiraceae bacterium]|nr:aminotransferase class I/II-fold pyridoxal phosphate-dependent enzyme [Lachnospiraceae bacterium]